MNNSLIEFRKLLGKGKVRMVNQDELETSSLHQGIDDQIALLKEWFVIFMAVNCINFLFIISQL